METTAVAIKSFVVFMLVASASGAAQRGCSRQSSTTNPDEMSRIIDSLARKVTHDGRAEAHIVSHIDTTDTLGGQARCYQQLKCAKCLANAIAFFKTKCQGTDTGYFRNRVCALSFYPPQYDPYNLELIDLPRVDYEEDNH